MVGRPFGNFEILEEIGRGGMGVVYRARDSRLGREVALKLLRPDVVTDDQRARLIHEAKTAARIEHSNVARVYELDQVEGTPYVAMELVRGQTLRSRLEAGALGPDEALGLAEQVLHGLRAAHELGVLHRDLKPDNVSVAADGTAKILDFGLARLRADLEEPASAETIETRTVELSYAGAMAGTVPYMSPEQIAGRALDARSDLFSFGVMLYELLAGERPFPGDTARETIHSILSTEPRPLSSVRPAVGRALDRVLARCLAKRPEDRYASAGELLDALRAGRRASPRRGRRLALAVLVPVVVAAAAFFFRYWQPGGASGSGAGEENALRVAVAPFSSIGSGSSDQGRVVRELVERELRAKGSTVPLRLLEGAIAEPVDNEEQARAAGREVDADVVCWGKLLSAGGDAEVEARLTLLRPLDRVAPVTVEASLLPGPREMLELAGSMAVDEAGELAMLRVGARRVADLVTTLAGLALFTAGDYAEAESVLSTIEDPGPDQRFYRGLALLRGGRAAEAAAEFREVLARAPGHAGALVGLGVTRSQTDPDHEGSEQPILDALEARPFDARTNALFAIHTVQSALEGSEDVERFASHARRLCERPATQALPEPILEYTIWASWILRNAAAARGRPAPPLDFITECPAFREELERNGSLRLFTCISDRLGGTPWSGSGCTDWTPDPYAVTPWLYVMFAVDPPELDDPAPGTYERLVAIAERDPGLGARAPDWAVALSVLDTEQALDWLDRQPRDAALVPGRRELAEGMLLYQLERWDDALERFSEAAPALGDDAQLASFRGATLLATSRFEEVLAHDESPDTPARSLALAATGRLCEAYGIGPDRLPPEGHSAEAFAVDLLRVCSGIERDKTMHGAHTEWLKRQIASATREGHVAAHVNFSATTDSPEGTSVPALRLQERFEPDLRFQLVPDPLWLLESVGRLGATDGGDEPLLDAEAAGQAVARLSRELSAASTGRDSSQLKVPWMTYVRLGQAERAEQELRRSIEERALDPRRHTALADFQMFVGRHDAALQTLDRAIALAPDDGDLWQRRGRSLGELQRWAAAAEAFERAARLAPRNAEPLRLLCWVERRGGRFEEAERAVARALELDPRYAFSHWELGWLRRDQGRLGDAVVALRRATVLAPTQVEMHRDLGNTLIDVGDYAGSEAPLRKAMELEPDNWLSAYQVARSLRLQKRFDEADALHEIAERRNPDNTWIHWERGRIRFDQGRFAEAIEHYRRALEKDASNKEAQQDLAACLAAVKGELRPGP